jgi:hypothetical protein
MPKKAAYEIPNTKKWLSVILDKNFGRKLEINNPVSVTIIEIINPIKP